VRNLNKPNRYNVASIQAQQTLGGDVMQADENGQYVEFRDYAWLLAEKQRLDDLCKQLMAQHSDISCENIRLRKAGDRLVFALEAMDIIMDTDSDHPEVAEWNAAKEGKLTD
jgi:hypothetical protein